MDIEKCGRFIAEKRKSLGFTQLMLGECLGISDKAVSNWERGKRFPDIELLEPLAIALDTNVVSILHGEETESIMPIDIVKLIKHERKCLRVKWCMNLCFAVLLTITICLVPEQLYYILKVGISKFSIVRVIISVLVGFFANRVIREPETLGIIAYVLSMLWLANELATGLIIKYELNPGFLPFDGRLNVIIPAALLGMLCSHFMRKNFILKEASIQG